MQLMLVTLIVMAAGFFLGKYLWRARFKTCGSGCVSCGGCGSADAAPQFETQAVPIQLRAASRRLKTAID